MAENGQDKVAAFDTLFTDNRIQKLKILLPCLDGGAQRRLAVCIKFLELRHTLSLLRRRSLLMPLPKDELDPDRICSQLLPYCSPDERRQLESLQNLLRSLENYREMMEMLESLRELFPEGEENDPLSALSGLAGMSGEGGDLLSALSALAGMKEEKNPHS